MARVGYVRSGDGADAAVAALTAAGCERTVIDAAGGPWAVGPELERVLAVLDPGDQLVVGRLGELGPSLGLVAGLVLRLAERRVDLVVLEQRIDTTGPGGTMLFAVAEAFAGVEGTGRPRRRTGRPSVMTPAKVDAGRRLLRDGTATATAVARQLGVSRSTLYRHCGPDLEADGATG